MRLSTWKELEEKDLPESTLACPDLIDVSTNVQTEEKTSKEGNLVFEPRSEREWENHDGEEERVASNKSREELTREVGRLRDLVDVKIEN